MRRAELRETMLRISGAMQVLGELLTNVDSARHDGKDTNEVGSATAQVRRSGM